MRKRYETIDPNELIEADDINKTTIKGEMRIHYLGINQKLKEGRWSAKDVVAWFNDRGVPITVDIFRVYLLALDKEHGYKRSTNEYINTPQKILDQHSGPASCKPQPSSSTLNKSNDTNPLQTSESRKISNPADLKKARNQEVNLDDYEE